jgi:hypothetical protein
LFLVQCILLPLHTQFLNWRFMFNHDAGKD